MRNVLQSVSLTGYEPEIGHWLWAMEDVRHRTVDSVAGLDPSTVDWAGPEGSENTIGSLLYHIALVEISWLFMDIFESEFPTEVRTLFPYAMATNERLTPVLGLSLEEHLDRLSGSRRIFLEALKGMSVDDWHRLRSPEDTSYQVTPAWVAFHLIEHEAGHAAQIRSLKARSHRAANEDRETDPG
jgi:uncharacterized damage-inducible protein DinB